MCLFCKTVLTPDIYFDNFYCWYNKVRPAVLQLLPMWNPLIFVPDQGCSFWCMSASSPRSVTNWASTWVFALNYNIRNTFSSCHTISQCQMANSKSSNSKFCGLMILPYYFLSHNILTAIKSEDSCVSWSPVIWVPLTFCLLSLERFLYSPICFK
jgi:hypothetical protein